MITNKNLLRNTKSVIVFKIIKYKNCIKKDYQQIEKEKIYLHVETLKQPSNKDIKI